MPRIRILTAFPAASLALAATACTPLGAWLYDDPSFTLAQVEYHPAGDGTDSLEVVITGCNRNDYELMGFGFETQLLLDGRAVGSATLTNAYQLATRDSTQLTMVLPLSRTAGLSDPAAAMRYELVGSTRIQTPIGERRVPMRQRGNVARSEDGYQWTARDVLPCRPGQSTLPGAWDTKTTLPGPDRIPVIVQPAPGQGIPGQGLPGSPGPQ